MIWSYFLRGTQWRRKLPAVTVTRDAPPPSFDVLNLLNCGVWAGIG